MGRRVAVVASSSSAIGARIEAPKATRGMRCGEGMSPPHGGGSVEEAVLPPKRKKTKNIDFGSQIGEFWCELGAFCIQFT